MKHLYFLNIIHQLKSRHLFNLVFLLACFLFSTNSFGQCTAYTANIACTTAAPTVVASSITYTPPQNNGGRRNFLVTNMIAGATYRVSNCGSGFDTQMTIRNSVGTSVAYNDDNGPACAGSAASIDFIPATTGDYRIQLNRFNCATANNLNGDIVVTLMSLPENTVPFSGNNSFTLCSSNLYDNGGSGSNYANSSNGYTVLNPITPGDLIQLTGTYDTEATFDFLYIYDGTGTGGTLLGTYTGAGTIPTITSTSGSLTVEFTSDGSFTDPGFNLSIACVPPLACTGTPSAGTITVTPSSGNPGSTYGVTATGFTSGTNLTYQYVDSRTLTLKGIIKSYNALLLKIVFTDKTQLYKKALY